MSFSVDRWMKEYINAVEERFFGMIWFLGLQGSYGRGEVTDNSDIDVVLILDSVSIEDLDSYSKMLDNLPNRDKVCGFVSGKNELLLWEPSDLFQFYYDTTPILGSLDELLNKIHKDDILRAIRIGACNVYHMCVHNLVHEKSEDILKSLYKSASFTLQAIGFLNTGKYGKKKTELLTLLKDRDGLVLKTGIELKNKEKLIDKEFKNYSGLLLNWASGWICEAQYG